MNRTRFSLLGMLISSLLVGCGESKQTVEVDYSRPAEYSIPDKVHTIAVSEFGGQTNEDRRWADFASDKLAADIQSASQSFSRYSLIDRKNLKKMLDEQDVQIATGSDPEAANKAGKAANAQAIIYGSVHVDCRDEQGVRTVFDPLNRTTREVPTMRRYCRATLTFSMNDPFTSKTLATKVVTREYDSSKEKKSSFAKAGEAMGMGGNSSDAMTQEEALNKLVTECVDDYMAMISPHFVHFQVELESGKSDLVKTGNKLAASGDIEGALRLYQQALEAKGEDDGAAFNAGVMSEKLGKPDEAGRYYSQALSIKCKDKYIAARQRLGQENKAGT